MKNNDEVRSQVHQAIAACQDKKAEEISILEMEKGSGAFTDYFVVCSGTNPRQIQAIADEVEERLEKAGLRPNSIEGYKQAEWVLLDYVDFVVHIFSEKARQFYDLERLCGHGHMSSRGGGTSMLGPVFLPGHLERSRGFRSQKPPGSAVERSP